MWFLQSLLPKITSGLPSTMPARKHHHLPSSVHVEQQATRSHMYKPCPLSFNRHLQVGRCAWISLVWAETGCFKIIVLDRTQVSSCLNSTERPPGGPGKLHPGDELQHSSSTGSCLVKHVYGALAQPTKLVPVASAADCCNFQRAGLVSVATIRRDTLHFVPFWKRKIGYFVVSCLTRFFSSLSIFNALQESR